MIACAKTNININKEKTIEANPSASISQTNLLDAKMSWWEKTSICRSLLEFAFIPSQSGLSEGVRQGGSLKAPTADSSFTLRSDR